MMRPLSAIDAPFDSLADDETIVRSLHFVGSQSRRVMYRIVSPSAQSPCVPIRGWSPVVFHRDLMEPVGFVRSIRLRRVIKSYSVTL